VHVDDIEIVVHDELPGAPLLRTAPEVLGPVDRHVVVEHERLRSCPLRDVRYVVDRGVGCQQMLVDPFLRRVARL
jgi:hypothetical protein